MYHYKSIVDLIKTRKSVRNFTDKAISAEIKKEIIKFILTLESPFADKFRLELINIEEDLDGGKFGSYGLIKGAKNYVGIAVQKSDFDYENLGYVFEKLVLFLQDLGLETCWFGGNLKGTTFEKAMELKENELFPIMSPFGYGVETPSLMIRLIKFAVGSNKRKDWDKLFFDTNFETPLKKEGLGIYEEALEMLRLAPSAMNLQPWRVVKDGNKYHFFVNNPKKNKSPYYIQRVDIGIALCHFDLVLGEKGVKGKFFQANPKLNTDFKYIITWEAI